MKYLRPTHRCRGFTLLELLLAISMIAILGVMTMAISLSYRSTYDLQLTASAVAQMLRRAQTLAVTGTLGSTWSIRISGPYLGRGSEPSGTNMITLFRGSDYNTRDTSYDETYAIPTTIQVDSGILNVSGGIVSQFTMEYYFQPYTGLLSIYGAQNSLTLLDTANNTSIIISTNAQGAIFY